MFKYELGQKLFMMCHNKIENVQVTARMYKDYLNRKISSDELYMVTDGKLEWGYLPANGNLFETKEELLRVL